MHLSRQIDTIDGGFVVHRVALHAGLVIPGRTLFTRHHPDRARALGDLITARRFKLIVTQRALVEIKAATVGT